MFNNEFRRLPANVSTRRPVKPPAYTYENIPVW